MSAVQKNQELEFERNKERFLFLKVIKCTVCMHYLHRLYYPSTRNIRATQCFGRRLLHRWEGRQLTIHCSSLGSKVGGVKQV